jgi:hypothetical protein
VKKYIHLTFDGGRRGIPPLRLLLECTEDARLEEDGNVGSGCLRQLVLDDADEVDMVVANVETERILWLLYRVNVLDDVFVLDVELRQLLLDVAEPELLGNGRPLRVLVGDPVRRDGACT